MAETPRATRQHALPTSLATIVVSYNVRDLLRACLASTYASLARAPELAAEVYVVENASDDGSADMVAAEFPNAKLIVSDRNLGFAGGNNLVLRMLGFGRREASGPSSGDRSESLPSGSGDNTCLPPALVFLLNPDAEPLEDAIGRMVTFLERHDRVGGVGAQLQYPDGRFQHGAYRFPGLLQLWFDLFPPRPRRLLDSRLNGRYPRSRYASGRPFSIDFALGAALMVRREAIESAGLLDEGYFMYAEEVDWCWRIQQAGWPFFCVPDARVVHHGGASTGQFRHSSFVNLWLSRHRLYGRFYGPVRRTLAKLIVRLGMWVEIRRVEAGAARGAIGSSERDECVNAAREVAAAFRG